MPKEMKVAELREALEARGLDSSGLKPALVARLQAALDHQDQCDQKVPSPDPHDPRPVCTVSRTAVRWLLCL